MAVEVLSTSILDLQRLSTKELVALFKTLKAPTIAQMNGEYSAKLLSQPFWLAKISGQLAVANPLMPWLCKAFRPVTAQEGRGYNTFLWRNNIIQRYPMKTRIALSRYDNQPVYQLVYRAYHSLCGDIYMVDEVRQLSDTLYLGIGTWGFTKWQQKIPLPFVLEGPIADYRGDIGQERVDFNW